jgi:hypothetical protein
MGIPRTLGLIGTQHITETDEIDIKTQLNVHKRLTKSLRQLQPG